MYVNICRYIHVCVHMYINIKIELTFESSADAPTKKITNDQRLKSEYEYTFAKIYM